MEEGKAEKVVKQLVGVSVNITLTPGTINSLTYLGTRSTELNGSYSKLERICMRLKLEVHC